MLKDNGEVIFFDFDALIINLTRSMVLNLQFSGDKEPLAKVHFKVQEIISPETIISDDSFCSGDEFVQTLRHIVDTRGTHTRLRILKFSIQSDCVKTHGSFYFIKKPDNDLMFFHVKRTIEDFREKHFERYLVRNRANGINDYDSIILYAL